MNNPPVTAFQETAALYHVLNEDRPKARDVIADMLPGERDRFAAQLETLIVMLGSPCARCGARTPETENVMRRPLETDRYIVCAACNAGPDR